MLIYAGKPIFENCKAEKQDASPSGMHVAGPTKLFVLLEAPASAPLPPGFFPKRNYQPKLRNTLQVHLSLESTAEGGDLDRKAATEVMWLQCKKHITGWKSPPLGGM